MQETGEYFILILITMGIALGVLFTAAVDAIGTGLAALGAAVSSAAIQASVAAGFITPLAISSPLAFSVGAPLLLGGGTITSLGTIYAVTTSGYVAFALLGVGAIIGIGVGIGFGVEGSIGSGSDPFSPYIPIEDRLVNECYNFNPFDDELSSNCRVQLKRKSNMQLESWSPGYDGMQYDVPDSGGQVVEQQFSRGQYRSNARRQVGKSRKRMR